MKNFCLTLSIFVLCNLLLAQNRQEKILLKSLKKEYGLYDAYYMRSWRDNYAYIILRTKDWDTMISDSLGNIIIRVSS